MNIGGCSIDIITLERLKKLQYTEKDLEVVEVPILAFRGKLVILLE